MAKKKRKFSFVVNRSVTSSVWAVILVVTLPALYILFFTAKANTDLSKQTTTVQGYLNEEICTEQSDKNCYQVTTIQEDSYWIPQN